MTLCLCAALISPAFADVTVDITGATAFRAATLAAIKAKFVESGVAFQYAHDQAEAGVTGATLSIWKGKFPGVTGVTTIRTSFNGSVEGLKALVDSPTSDPKYYTDIPGNLVTAAAIGGGETHKDTVGFLKTNAASQSEIAFSDVAKAATPYAASSLQPTSSSAVGVVVFTMLANEGSTITNVTSQNFRALLTAGNQKKSLFTGVAADDNTLVYAVGRNDGSGTRTTYMAECGLGITTKVQQYVVNQTSGNANTVMQIVPAGGVGAEPLTGQLAANASTVWGQDEVGNGGYSSGSTLRGDMGRTTDTVQILDEEGSEIYASKDVELVTFLSLNDAVSARGNGAVFCAYNGVKLDGIATSGSSMTTADLAKVTRGAYTAWSYQQMYRRNDLTSGDNVTVYNGLFAAVQDNLGSAGIKISDMKASRDTDGGVVAPTL